MTNTTWAIKGSPFIVTGDVIVDKGVVLTVEPGVAVEFDGYYKLTVVGALDARGTVDGRITFGPSTRNTNGWGGIRVESPDPSILRWATISDGDARIEGDAIGGALFVNGASADVTLDRCTITRNHAVESGGAIGVLDGALTLTKWPGSFG